MLLEAELGVLSPAATLISGEVGESVSGSLANLVLELRPPRVEREWQSGHGATIAWPAAFFACSIGWISSGSGCPRAPE